MYILTKSKIASGLQCPKKLWFDVNQPIKQDLHIFYIGNRFGDFARQHYGTGLNLTGNLNAESALRETEIALKNPKVNVIYEAAFLYADTLIRADVLVREGDQWKLIEVKSSTGLKPEHIKDAAIQAYVIQSQGIELSSVNIAHISNRFIYQGDGIYKNFLVEVDVTEKVHALQNEIPLWIETLKPLGIKGAAEPSVEMGAHCKEPYDCPYQTKCTELLPKFEGVPITILPGIGKKLAEIWGAKGVYDLRDLPAEAMRKSIHREIQKAHQTNTTWIDPALQAQVNGYGWPRFFMDFETVQQGVPLLPGTKAYDALPFQWSVHRWDDQEQVISLNDGASYLEFFNLDMSRQFLTTLLDAVGVTGPIFVHNASFERSKLRALIERADCANLKYEVESLIDRIVDTLELTRAGFYAPVMNGSYSLKDIVKAIPTDVDYASDDALSGGGQAQSVWFKCTDPATPQAEKDEWTRRLINYCAQDTLAMYHLLRYLAHPEKFDTK